MQPQLVGKKSQYRNFAEDGIKIRSNTFKNVKKYSRKDKTWVKEINEN